MLENRRVEPGAAGNSAATLWQYGSAIGAGDRHLMASTDRTHLVPVAIADGKPRGGIFDSCDVLRLL